MDTVNSVGPNKDPARIAGMFDRVAARYDITNTVMTGGLDRWWRRQTRQALDLQPWERCLDVAAGTAVSTVELARSGADVVGCDFSLGMLQAGRNRPGAEAITLVAGDATALPFLDATFDAVTISFGLRNIADRELALREMARVTKPGGRLVICEVSHPPARWLRTAHGAALRALPLAVRPIASDHEAYEYFVESCRDWPSQAELAALVAESGWRRVRWRNLTGGVVALHHAIRT